MAQRENWASKLGVILAVAGSAVGLGNFLVFPGRVAANGGGAFLIPYFVAFILIGIPLAWIEWALGRHGGRYGHGSGPGVLSAAIKRPYAKYLGSLGVVGPLLIFFFYIYIESWLLGFIWYSFTGALTVASQTPDLMGKFFGDYIGLKLMIGNIPSALLFFALTFIINFAIIFFGVRKGIENTAKVLMPVLLVLGLVMLFRVLTLEGISVGLGFMWNPDLSKLTDINVWFAATSQIFFTLSVGIGCILTYASYVKKDQDIALSSLTANGTNEFIEVIIGGTVVIPTAVVFLGLAGAQKIAGQGAVSLGFITMPMIFNSMTFLGMNIGNLFQIMWFILLFIGGVTSSVSILQPGISFLEDELQLKRKSSVTALAAVTLLYSLLVILGFNAGAADEIDLWGFQFSLLAFGTIEAILFAWILGADEGWKEINRGADIKIPLFFKFLIKYVTPTFLIGLLVLWFTIGGGMDLILLKNVKTQVVQVMGLEMTNKTFIVLMRLSLLLLLGIVNLLIYTTWKYKQQNDGMIKKGSEV